ncbi:MAG: hypoxanthine phosphoribosyltransferase [Chloroflexi bacterium RBG_13_52_14]|nr:MAG: hypoxanthine phosphoribosyltransferase [Chloroflexi bacterium RBG_13_52_14]
MDKTKVIITREEIANKVAEIATQLGKDYRGKNPLLIGILKGSFVFLSDLVRAMNIPAEIDFVRLASYGAGTESSGKIKLVKDVETPIKGRHVLVVEDIIDRGLTVRFLLDYLSFRKPASLKLCALFDKPSRRKVEVPIDYLGFTVPDAFVVGYGLDFDEKYRYLPDLCTLEEQ